MYRTSLTDIAQAHGYDRGKVAGWYQTGTRLIAIAGGGKKVYLLVS
jgi:hypothetical protein